MTPLVTVLLPTVGRMKYFPAALASVRQQTYTNLDILIGDNASSDGTADFIRELATQDSRIRSYHEAERSMPVNWQRGVELARGELLAIVGDDDVLKPGFIGRCVAEFERDPSLDVVTTLHELIDSEDAPLPNLSAHLQAAFRKYGEGRCELHWRSTEIASTIMCSVMRRKWVGSLGFRALAGLAADADLFWRAALAGYAACFIHEPHVLYRLHPGAATGARVQQSLDTLRAQEDLEAQHAELSGLANWQRTRRAAVETALHWLLRTGRVARALALFRANRRWLSGAAAARFLAKFAAASAGLYPRWIGREVRDPRLS